HYAATLKKNRDMMCAFFDALQERGIIQYERPRAGFYLFFRTDQPNSFDVVMDVLQQANVAMTPGTDFGPSATPFIRVCFARNPEVLEESITRLSKYFAKKYPEKFY
ncbi:aminotransferase class I/II-fold pyridoxal phosphate-dependent enzyme, partial [Candidatus Dependentiae bacterium]|nr:aminotransferase class I/II-fold pyridoxal phosphate-dependent enzyme [Candidatus Dependentiae bacterium]